METMSRRETALRMREAAEADRPRLVELINKAFSMEAFLGGTRTDETRLAAEMEKGRVLVAEDGAGRMVASVYMERRGGNGYLGMLAVDPAEQRKGLAHRLVEEAEERLRREGCAAVEILVLSLRPELLPVYRRFGYVETGIEEFRPGRPLQPGLKCHCIVMTKRL
jgi:predicted N-acetyltransferase YhbS